MIRHATATARSTRPALRCDDVARRLILHDSSAVPSPLCTPRANDNALSMAFRHENAHQPNCNDAKPPLGGPWSLVHGLAEIRADGVRER
jgi:hypothetical protein